MKTRSIFTSAQNLGVQIKGTIHQYARSLINIIMYTNKRLRSTEEVSRNSGTNESRDLFVNLSVYLSSSKWKADRSAVTSLCVSPDGKLLLSAGQVIKMWDLDTKEVYRVSLSHLFLIEVICSLYKCTRKESGLSFVH